MKKTTKNASDRQLKKLYDTLQAPMDLDGNPISLEENAKVIAKMMTLASQPRVDMQNAFEVRDRTNFYLNAIMQQNIKPSIASYALCLGIGKNEIALYLSGRKGCPQSVADILDRTRLIIASCTESYMTDGKMNPVTGIFLLRNGAGYTNLDTNESDYGMKSDNRRATAEELAEKYKDIAIEEDNT